MKNIAFVGGGTGGHIFPIKSLIEYMYDNKIHQNFNTILWIGEKNSLEQNIAKSFDGKNGFQFVPIFSGKLRRYLGIKAVFDNIVDIFKVIIGFFQSINIIRKNNIDIIFCKGGYVALPFVFAGKLMGKKIYVHESDTVPGVVNKIASKFSKKTFCGFKGVLNGIYVGQIISNDLIKSNDLGIKLNKTKTNILVMGGSQGAKTLYEGLGFIMDETLIDEFNFFVVLGLKNVELRNMFQRFPNIQCFDFLSQGQMGSLFRICDVGLTRGSATSMAEQKAFGMKLIIVPLPYTGGNHQYYNALKYIEEYDDVLIKQDEKLIDNLRIELKKIVGYKKRNVENIDFDQTKKIIFEEMMG